MVRAAVVMVTWSALMLRIDWGDWARSGETLEMIGFMRGERTPVATAYPGASQPPTLQLSPASLKAPARLHDLSLWLLMRCVSN